MTNNENEKFLKMADIAAQLNVSRSTVYRLIKTGALPAVRIGKNFRVRPADLEAYLTGARAANTNAGGAAE